jgi:hypothetical protein
MRFFRSFIPLLVAVAALAAPPTAFAQVAVGVSITVAPPVLPVYVQPAIPAPGYIWTPGYWAWGPYGYYWVPGTWVLPPAVGFLWTPGYWGWAGGSYLWHAGYWGPHIGFYGGINYGFGYFGAGYVGGFWRNGAFHYNTAVNNIRGAHITNVYNRAVGNNRTVERVSFNGGAGGTAARPTPQEEAAARDAHRSPTALQTQHEHAASTNHASLASVNHGRPTVAATRRPGAFHGAGVVAAQGVRPPAHPANANRPPQAVHPAGGGVAHGRGGPPHPPAEHGGAPHGGEDHHQ